jgi:hypothetical protein
VNDSSHLVAEAARIVGDLIVGCFFIAFLITLTFLPDIGRYAKRGLWAVADALFHLAVTAVMAVIHGAESFMDAYWRIRCKVLRKHPRPY